VHQECRVLSIPCALPRLAPDSFRRTALGFRRALGLLFRRNSLRKGFAASLAIPFFEGLGFDLALDQELGKFATLRLALEWHENCAALSMSSPVLPDDANQPDGDLFLAGGV
jgi:hypothetical protein